MSRDDGAILITPDAAIAALLPKLLEHRRRDVDIIIAMLARDGFGELTDLGHRLVGQGRSYGCDGVSAIGHSLELAAARRDAAAIRRVAAALGDYLDRALVAG